MERPRFRPDALANALPVIAPLTNSGQVADAINNGRYTEAMIGTAFGVGIGIIGRHFAIKELQKYPNETVLETDLSIMDLEDSQYKEPELSLQDSRTPSPLEQE